MARRNSHNSKSKVSRFVEAAAARQPPDKLQLFPNSNPDGLQSTPVKWREPPGISITFNGPSPSRITHCI